MSPAVGRLVRTDLKLMIRGPLVLTFAFAFPVVTMLVIGGAFRTAPEPGPDRADPSVPASGCPGRRARHRVGQTTRSQDSSTSNVTGHIPDGGPCVMPRIIAPTAICHNDPAAGRECVPRGGRSIKVMNGEAGTARAAGFPPGWARWSGLAAFTALVAVGLARLNPSPPVAVAAAVVAAGAGVLLAQQRRPLLVYAAVATGGIAVLGHGLPSNVSWFAVCLLGAWCVLTGSRRDGLAYWAAAMALFAAEWLWVKPDPGWGAWMAGTTLSVLGGLLIRHEVNLVSQLRAAQAGLAERAKAEERNRIARELHDVIAHTLTVMLLHVSSARLAVEHDLADAARALAEAERLGRASLAEVRLTVGMLHHDGDTGQTAPLPGLDDLSALVARFRSAGADVALTIDGDTGRLPATTGLAVYRIVQEALTNAVKHAPGSPTAVRLAVDADAVRLAVDSAAEPGGGTGVGVFSMRERAESLGGSCRAGPGGRGWLVQATLPLDAARRREVAS